MPVPRIAAADSPNVYPTVQNAVADQVDRNTAAGGGAPGATFIPFGDSFVDQSGGQTYNDDASRQWSRPALWLELLLQGHLAPIRNAGVNGDTTGMMLARIDADVIAHKPKIVMLQSAGLNDVKGAGTTFAGTTANLTAMFDKMKDAGILCVTTTIPPSLLIDTAAEKEFLFRLNRWLLEQATKRAGLIVADVYPLVSQAAAVDWDPAYNDDGTHPNGKGALVIARPMANALLKVLPTIDNRLPNSNVDPFELCTNPLMLGNTAGVADATSVGLNASGVASKVARTDGRVGEWQRWAQTSGTGLSGKTVTAGFAAGDRVKARFELRHDFGPGTPHNLAAFIDCRNAANLSLLTVSVLLSSSLAGDTPAISGDVLVVETNAAVVPTGTTSILVRYRMAGTATVDIGRISLRKV